MTKVRIQVRYCCCCSLTVTTVLIAIYTILLFVLLTGLATWNLARNSDENLDIYTKCLQEAKSKKCTKAGVLLVKQVGDGSTVNVIATTEVGAFVPCDASSYHCSLGLYTEELKYESAARNPVLVLNIVIFVLLVICAILILVGLLLKMEWLLLPWIAVMAIEIIRGIISCILIFVHSQGALSRIAVGIFFLGVQLFHISLIMIIIAKFQRMHDKKKGIDYKLEKHPEKVMVDGSMVYPTLPSHYAYSNSPHARREGFYQPQNYNTYAGNERQAVRALPPPENGYGYSQQYSRQDNGRTM